MQENLLAGSVDEWFARTTGGQTQTYLTDALGSTLRLTDGSGAKLVDYTYDAYGGGSQDATSTNLFQYTGRENDGLGLYNYRARYYKPKWGRFISQDPIGLAGGGNLYGYAGGSPASFSDPYGLCPFCVPIFVFVAEYSAELLAAAEITALVATGTPSPETAGPAAAANATRQCVAKEITLSRGLHGEAALHAEDAIRAGAPDVLTIDRAGAASNRKAAIGSLDKVPTKQLDEYPPAMFKEGGSGASVRPISPRDNLSAGACIGNACRGLPNETQVRIKIGP